MEVTEQVIKNMVVEFEEELEAEAITTEPIIKKIKDYFSELQAIGSEVFSRWVNLLKPGKFAPTGKIS